MIIVGVMTNLPVPVSTQDELPAIPDRAGPAARFAAQEFFSTRLANPHTRLSCSRWVHRFLTWCDHQYTVERISV